MSQPDQERLTNPIQPTPNGGAGSVIADLIDGDVLTGEFARKVVAGTYIEQQTVTITEEQIDVIVAKLNVVQDKLWDGRMPYVGLKPFSEERSGLFFGRSNLVKTLALRVESSSFLCITGPSGSGKSSILHAGLIPQLKKGLVAESEDWLYVPMTPKSEPVAQLAAGLAIISKTGTRAEEINSAKLLLEYVKGLLKNTNYKRVVLAIDQFEELFTQIKDEGLRQSFTQLLLDGINDSDGLIKIIIVVRSDFFADCLNLPGYLALIKNNLEIVGPMNVEELTEAIVKPAKEVGASLETALVTRLILDSKGDPGALPLVQFALDKLFRTFTIGDGKKPGTKIDLTLADYLQQGTIDRAIEIHADAALNNIRNTLLVDLRPDQAERILPFFFCQLVEVGQGRSDTRRIADFADLVPSKVDPKIIKQIVATLAAEEIRLVTVNASIKLGGIESQHDESDSLNDTTVALAHEKLIDFWPWLRDLISRERQNINLQDEIRKAATLWVKNKRNQEYLYEETRLNSALQQFKAGILPYSQLSHEFISASQRRSRKRRFSKVGLATIFTVLFFPGLFVGANFWMYRQKANSVWQPISGFPLHAVTSIATAAKTINGIASIACVGTDHIGIGCTDDYSTWNLYQNKLPAGTSAWFNSKDRFWGALLGSVWSGQVRAVFDLAIDPMDSTRIVTFVREEGLYESRDSGVHWSQLKVVSPPAGFPTAGITKLYVDGNYLFIASGVQGPKEQNERLFISSDGGKSFPVDLSLEAGKVRDFRVVRNENSRGLTIYFVSLKGLYKANSNSNWIPTQIINTADAIEFVWIFYDPTQQLFYLVKYDGKKNWSYLFRRQPGAKNAEQWGVGHAGAIRDLAINPGQDVAGVAWALFENGEVFAIDPNGEMSSKGSRPGWFWAQTNLIWFAPDPENKLAYVPYLGHADGILKCSKCVRESVIDQK